jgi:hypothetical protein
MLCEVVNIISRFDWDPNDETTPKSDNNNYTAYFGHENIGDLGVVVDQGKYFVVLNNKLTNIKKTWYIVFSFSQSEYFLTNSDEIKIL